MFKFIEGTDNKMIVTSTGRIFKRYPVNRRHLEKGFTGFREVNLHLCLGYLKVNLNGIPQYVHRLVAEAFIPKPLGATDVDHIDGNKLNNRVENLRWVSHKENCNNPNTRYKNVYSSNRKVWSYIQGFNPKTNFRTPTFTNLREASAWITPEGEKSKCQSLKTYLNKEAVYRGYFWTAKLVTGEEYRKLLE